MLANEHTRKLVALTSKAISINEQLLREEKKFVEAVSQNKDARIINQISNKIQVLNRKETLYLGATRSLIQGLK